MLELIIDKAFLWSFFDAFDEKNDFHQDIKKFFRKVKNFALVNNCEELDNLANLNPTSIERLFSEIPFFELLFDRINLQKSRYVPTLCDKIQQKLFYKEGSVFKLFFVELSELDCQTCKQKFGYAYLNSQNIDNEWKIFDSEREDTRLTVTKSPDLPADLKFDNWTKLRSFQHPINSILLFDNYILCEKVKRDGSLKYGLNDNIKPLLRNLLSNCQLDVSLEIIIFSQEIQLFNSIASNQIELIYNDLVSYITTQFPQLNFKLSLVKHDQALYRRIRADLEHDRFLITNYFSLKCGGGFDLFDRNNRINRRTEIELSFVFDYRFSPHLLYTLENLKKYTSVAIEFYPDKTNRLLQ